MNLSPERGGFRADGFVQEVRRCLRNADRPNEQSELSAHFNVCGCSLSTSADHFLLDLLEYSVVLRCDIELRELHMDIAHVDVKDGGRLDVVRVNSSSSVSADACSSS